MARAYMDSISVPFRFQDTNSTCQYFDIIIYHLLSVLDLRVQRV